MSDTDSPRSPSASDVDAVPVNDPLPYQHPAPTLPTSYRRRKTSSTAPRPSPSQEWVDIDDHPPSPQRPLSKRATRRDDRNSRLSSSSGSVTKRSSKHELTRFLPQLDEISESSSPAPGSTVSTAASDTPKRSAKSAVHRSRPSDNASVAGYRRRPAKKRVGNVSKRNDSVFKVNPSLLSVLTSLTGVSDKSSSSNTTITQRSFDRHLSEASPSSSASRIRRSLPEQRASLPNHWQEMSLPVFQYMDSPSEGESHDGQSVASSPVSSHYEPSDAGSSDMPDTPSSRSTFPSPTATRSGSISGHVAELRRKYDVQAAAPATRSVRSGSLSPGSTSGVAAKQPKVSDVAENEHESSSERSGSQSPHDLRMRSSSRSSSTSHRSDHKLRHREDALRRHMAQAQGGHYVDPAYEQQQQQQQMSQSVSSTGSADAQPPFPYPPQMAMQPYHYPTPPASMGYPTPPHSMNGHMAPVDRPPVPDAPDLTQYTLTGYEKLAVELSKSGSAVKPMYRKFDYLNHRLLLHLQDELSELEEQLRLMDEIVAQMDPASSSDVPRTPSSRRGDAYSHSEIHHRRTALLGRIFLKTEQYNRAMASYAAMNKECRPAEREQIDAYRTWLAEQTPIHDDETKFLQRDNDLVLPGAEKKAVAPSPPSADANYRPTKHAALTCLPVALMLPLLLYSIIPTLGGRLVVTALIAVGVFMVASTTRIRHLMPMNEWAVCGGAYVLLMTAIAGCIPQHEVK